jgi:putative transposase
MEDSDKEHFTIPPDLDEEALRKLEVVQHLLEPCDRATYGERLRESAHTLGISVRSVQRLFKLYQKEGIGSLISTNRKDKGYRRIGEDWSELYPQDL